VVYDTGHWRALVNRIKESSGFMKVVKSSGIINFSRILLHGLVSGSGIKNTPSLCYEKRPVGPVSISLIRDIKIEYVI
jgi:hypothetical protein